MEIEGWVKLTHMTTKKDVYVKISNIRYVSDLNGTAVALGKDHSVYVTETVERVMKAVDEAD